MTKKSLGQYLTEIVIIVIGVLIAFLLSNWGESIKNKKTEKEIISQVYFELGDNLSDLKNDLAILLTGLASHNRIQGFLDGNGLPTDSLVFDFYWAATDEYIFPNTSAYENLNNIGMSIIRDDALKNIITLVYNNNFPRISKGNNFHPDITAYLTPYMKDNFKVNRDASLKYTLNLNDSLSIDYPRDYGMGIQQIIGYIPKDPDALRQSDEFKFLMSEVFWFRMYKIGYYQLSISNVEKILRRIEEKYPKAIN